MLARLSQPFRLRNLSIKKLFVRLESSCFDARSERAASVLIFVVALVAHEWPEIPVLTGLVRYVEENFDADSARVLRLSLKLPQANLFVGGQSDGLNLRRPLYLARVHLGDVKSQHNATHEVRVRYFVLVDLVDALDNQRPAIEEQRQIEGEWEADELPAMIVRRVDHLSEPHRMDFKLLLRYEVECGTEILRRFNRH